MKTKMIDLLFVLLVLTVGFISCQKTEQQTVLKTTSVYVMDDSFMQVYTRLSDAPKTIDVILSKLGEPAKIKQLLLDDITVENGIIPGFYIKNMSRLSDTELCELISYLRGYEVEISEGCVCSDNQNPGTPKEYKDRTWKDPECVVKFDHTCCKARRPGQP